MILQIGLMLLALSVLTVFVFWAITFKRSFTPIQGEIYVITFFGMHILEVRLGDPKVKWYQKLPFYLLFWPFGRASFIYEWKQEMTYADYLKKVEKARTTKDYDVSIDWEPQYLGAGTNIDGSTRESEIGTDGMPKDKSVKILVTRKEKMLSLRQTEGYTLVAEFETSDGFRGWRFFTLFLNVENLSEIISKIRQWQAPAQLTFKGAYNAWSKGVTYVVLRTTTIDKLNLEIGRDKNEPFIDEVNEKVSGFGYSIGSIKEGVVYFDLATRDMLESQEAPKKALDIKNAEIVNAETVEIKANAKAKAIETVQAANNKAIETRTKIATNAYAEISKSLVTVNTSKYGKDGLTGLKFYVEAPTGGENGTNTMNPQTFVNQILALQVNEDLQNEPS
jgi:hypothetical protein